jgi:hypothetical protein
MEGVTSSRLSVQAKGKKRAKRVMDELALSSKRRGNARENSDHGLRASG